MPFGTWKTSFLVIPKHPLHSGVLADNSKSFLISLEQNTWCLSQFLHLSIHGKRFYMNWKKILYIHIKSQCEEITDNSQWWHPRKIDICYYLTTKSQFSIQIIIWKSQLWQLIRERERERERERLVRLVDEFKLITINLIFVFFPKSFLSFLKKLTKITI